MLSTSSTILQKEAYALVYVNNRRPAIVSQGRVHGRSLSEAVWTLKKGAHTMEISCTTLLFSMLREAVTLQSDVHYLASRAVEQTEYDLDFILGWDTHT